jgi:cell division protein FtsQ
MKVSRPPRLGSRLLGAFAVLVVIGLIASVFAGLNRPVDVVRVRGDLSKAELAAVQEATKAVAASGYLTVDLAEVARAVLALSWPRDVAVRRVWPSTLQIDVRKEAVAARWGEGRALSSSGEVIAVPQALPEELPLLDCARADGAEAMQTFLFLKDGLRDTDLEIAKLAENDFGEWRVTFRNGVELALGAEDISKRLERFASVYRGALESRIGEVARVDARYGNGVAVDWRNDASDGKNESDAPLPKAQVLERGLATTRAMHEWNRGGDD